MDQPLKPITCPFCNVQATAVWLDHERALACRDGFPVAEGHTLVIPKERKAHLHELSDESAAALGRVLPRLCRAVLQATGATDYNVLQNNGRRASQAVMHVHFHIIPKVGRTGLGIGWPAGNLEAATAAELLAKMRSALAAEEGGAPAGGEEQP